MDSSTFDDVILEATAIVDEASARFQKDFYAPDANRLGRMVWESMLPGQRQMVLDNNPQLADGVKRLLGSKV